MLARCQRLHKLGHLLSWDQQKAERLRVKAADLSRRSSDRDRVHSSVNSRHIVTGDTMPLTQKAFASGSACPPLSKDTLRLYSMRFCPFALRTRLVLAHKGISFETVNIDLQSKPEWFLAKNQKGLVPVLELNENIVAESDICNDLLDEMFPEKKLNPVDLFAHAHQRMIMERYRVITRSFYGIAFAKDKSSRQKAIETMARGLWFLEEELNDVYFGGKEPSMLDYHVYPHLAIWSFITKYRNSISGNEAMGGFSFPSHLVPKLADWLDRMRKLPAVKATSESETGMLKFVNAWHNRGVIDYDAGLNTARL